jgi:hypothetical protein
MSGTSYSTYAKLGTSLICGGAAWSNAVESTSYAWYSASSSYSFDPAKSTLVSNSSSLYLSEAVLRSLFGKYLICSATGVNGGGETIGYDYESISTPSSPYSASSAISGITYGSTPSVGSVATCTGSSSYNYDSLSYEWGFGTSSYSSYTSPLSTVLGRSSTLTLTKQVLDQIKGKYLVCLVTVTNLSGSGSGYDTEFITAPSQTAPDAPSITSVVAVDSYTATVSFAAPELDGWSAITSYAVTSSPGNRINTINQSSGGSINISGLTPGATYTFTAKATNSIGSSVASAQSTSITMPSTAPAPAPTPTPTPTPTP